MEGHISLCWSHHLKFEWDENKAVANIEKHGVSFREACTVFSDDDAITFDDIDHSFNEERFLIIGKSYKKNVLYVCYCFRMGDTIRIISARQADKEEREDYYAHYKSI